MKKVININFKGRVIPIEETAFEQLQKYTESLRRYFANEEGRDEIINDIEDRIAELFDEELKKGATCITDASVANIIASMGSVEDFEQMDNEGPTTNGHTNTQSSTASSSAAYAASEEPRGNLARNANDKIIGGVCGGIAHYLKIDPAIVRILFALITFGGFGTGVLIYLIMWIILPLRDLKTNIRKRLFRSPDDKVIGGVAGGLANYFNIPVWVPRLVFCLPLVLGVISSIFHNAWFDWDFEPDFVFGGFGGTLFVTYIILWIVLPMASSATDKLQMRGEKIDVNSIKNAVQEELGTTAGTIKEKAAEAGDDLKSKATQMGEELKESALKVSANISEEAKRFGSEMSQKSKAVAIEAVPVARSTGQGIGHAIGVLFKAFFLFIAGIVAFALLMALIGVIIGGVAAFPLKGFFLEGTTQTLAAWGALLLFFAVPVIALLTWVIRKIIGTKTRNPYLGYTFGGLWVIGLICLAILISSFFNNFRVSAHDPQDISIVQPAGGKMIVKVPSTKVKIYGRGFEWDDVFTVDGDSMYINNIRLRIVKSNDSLFHVSYDKRSSGATKDKAQANASAIQYGIMFKDSVLTLDKGFTVSENSKFRNQRVAVTIEVPVGKRIYIDRSVERLEWHNITFNGPRRHDWEWDDEWDSRGWNDTEVEYIMTEDGLERADGKDKKQEIIERQKDIDEQMKDIEEQKNELNKQQEELKNQKKENDSLRYRYEPKTPAAPNAPATNNKQIVEKMNNSGNEIIFQPMTVNAL